MPLIQCGSFSFPFDDQIPGHCHRKYGLVSSRLRTAIQMLHTLAQWFADRNTSQVVMITRSYAQTMPKVEIASPRFITTYILTSCDTIAVADNAVQVREKGRKVNPGAA